MQTFHVHGDTQFAAFQGVALCAFFFVFGDARLAVLEVAFGGFPSGFFARVDRRFEVCFFAGLGGWGGELAYYCWGGG